MFRQQQSEEKEVQSIITARLKYLVPQQPLKYQDALSKKLSTLTNSEMNKRLPLSNGVYIGTNESKIQDSATVLSELPKVDTDERCHIGFSGLHNFDIANLRQSSRIIICDVNPENRLFLSNVISILCECSERTQFIDSMVRYIEKHDLHNNPHDLSSSINFCPNASDEEIYDGVTQNTDQIRIELKRPNSWLHTEESFHYIRNLALNGKIALITENITNTATFKRIASLLQNNAIMIDSLYVSNIANYMEAQDQQSFLNTTHALIEGNSTIVIDAYHVRVRGYFTSTLAQRIRHGEKEQMANATAWPFPKKQRSNLLFANDNNGTHNPTENSTLEPQSLSSAK